MRKVLIVSIALIVLGIAGYFILNLNDKKQFSEDQNNGIQAIPYNAIAILRIKEPLDVWSELTKNQYGKNLLQIPEFATFSNSIKTLENIVKRQSVFANILSQSAVYLSLHKTGVNTFSYLGASSFNSKDKSLFIQAFSKEFPNATKIDRKYEEVEIVDFTFADTETSFSVAFNENLVLVSNSPILIDESILQLKHRVSLSEHKSFSKLFKTADINLDANLFVNYKELDQLLNHYGNREFLNNTKLSNIGNWMEMDLKIKDNGILMNGFSLIDDSAATFFSSFKGQKASKINVASILPSDLAFLSYSGFSDYSKLLDGKKRYLQQQQLLFSHEKNCENIENKYGINLKEDFYSWIGNEACFFINQGKQKNPFKNGCIAIETNDIDIATAALKKTQDKANGAVIGNYLTYQINNLNIPNFLSYSMGNTVLENENSYYTIIQDYVVFANDEANLKNIINAYAAGKTLIKNMDYNQFCENFSDESSFFVYLNPKKASNFWEYFLSPELAEILTKNQKVIDLFEAIGFQTVSNENLHFTNAYTNYKVVKENKAVALIECALDTTYSKTPWVVINHYTKEKELFLQDDNNTIYLINNVGKILWKKKLNGKIIGEVHIIDKYKNNKFQYLFGTGSELQLIDRNGKNVVGFPVQLKSKQTKGIAVADYENNKDYRIFVPCDKKLFNYNKDGKLVSGYSFKGSKNAIAGAPQYLLLDGKDYILFNDVAGTVYALNRKGENRLNLKSTLPSNRKNYEVVLGNSLANSGIISTSSNGTVVFVTLNDKREEINLQSFTNNHLFNLGNLSDNKSKDVIVFDEAKLSAYSLSKKEIFNLKDLEFTPSFGLQMYSLTESNNVIGITDKNLQKIYLYSQFGELMQGFPMEGNSPILIDDINNDGTKNLIIGNGNGSLFIYSVF